MKLEPGQLPRLAALLSQRAELALKRDVQRAAKTFGRVVQSAWMPAGSEIRNGDDAAALPTPGGGYVLFAAEGMREDFVAGDPWFAGYCAVMVNVADIAAMGGRPWAVVDVLFVGNGQSEGVLAGMKAASDTLGVPIVGGHTARVSGGTSLSAAIVGRAEALLSSHRAEPGQALLAAIDLRGRFRGPCAFDAATAAAPEALRAQLALLPALAEAGAAVAAKDISNAGLCGTLQMLLESSGCGARLDLQRVPAPEGVEPLRWLTAFPSFGYLLTTDPRRAPAVCERFARLGVECRVVGELTREPVLDLVRQLEVARLCDVRRTALTGFGAFS